MFTIKKKTKKEKSWSAHQHHLFAKLASKLAVGTTEKTLNVTVKGTV